MIVIVFVTIIAVIIIIIIVVIVIDITFLDNIVISIPVKGAIVIVDPFSTGAHLAAAVCAAGYKCARVFSIWDSPVAALVQQGLTLDYSATIQHNDILPNQDVATDETVAMLRALPFTIIAVIPGAETGVELADRLSHRLGLRSNGEAQSLARRNKYLMGEAVRKAGIRAVLQHVSKIFDGVVMKVLVDSQPHIYIISKREMARGSKNKRGVEVDNDKNKQIEK